MVRDGITMRVLDELRRSRIASGFIILNIATFALLVLFVSVAWAIVLPAAEWAFASAFDARVLEPRRLRIRLSSRPAWRNALWAGEIAAMILFLIYVFRSVNYGVLR